jgi:hypothetical protein
MKSNTGTAKSRVLPLTALAGLLCFTTLGVSAQVTAPEEPAERTIESLTIDGQTFTNVRVVRPGAKDVMFRHDGGITGFKVQYLDNPTLRRLGYEIAPPAPKPTAMATARLETLPDLVPAGNVRWGVLLLSAGVLTLMVGSFLYTGYVFRLICLKSGTPPGFAIWLPFLQAFPLLRAARMSWAWFVAVSSLSVLLAYAAFRAPEHTLVLGGILAAAIVGLAMVWSVRICHACGKSSLFAVLLLLPGLNYLALVHLAGSK